MCLNGYCTAPDVCECKKGYKKIGHQCKAICKNTCINGICSGPNRCSCFMGYELDPKNFTNCIPKCQPKCSEFSFCKSPNQCECLPGYIGKKVNNILTCLPECKQKCHAFSACTKPNKCECIPGYEEDKNSKKCVPKCEPQCPQYSTCKMPNQCQCDSGYIKNELTQQCDPHCDELPKYATCIEPPNTWECVNDTFLHDSKINKCILKDCVCKENGYCLEHPDEFECYEEFTKNITNKECVAVCKPECENSNCVANNVCHCFEGYHMMSDIHHACEANSHCDNKPCENGECLITGECKCKTGFIKSLTYEGHVQCDPVSTFIGKLMTVILGVPLILACCVLFAVYLVSRKRTYYTEEHEQG